MKDLVKIILIFILGYLFLRFAPSIPISSVVTQKQALFTVDGTGKITVVPDTAIIELSSNINQPTVKNAQIQANSIINKITADLKKLAVADKDIKTSQYSVYPQYNYQSGTNHITAYQVSISLTVTIRNLDNINQVIDTATADGVNTIGGIQLTVNEDRQKQLLQQARQEAVNDAKSKAEELSRAAGLSLGRLVNVEETSPQPPRPLFMTADKAAVGLGGGTEIQLGSTDITSSITLSYETR